MTMKNGSGWLLPSLAGAMMIGALYLVFLWVPTERSMGIVQRIFYFHMPPFLVAVVAILLGMGAAIRYLMTKDLRFDEVAVACIEVGLVFDTMNLLTGPFWARPVWGIWWTWDARLTSAFVLWLMFVGYLILRQAIDEPHMRAAASAVVTVFQAVGAVIVYMANRLWRTQHPQPVIAGGEGSGLASPMWVALLGSLAAMLVVFACLVQVRRRLERLRRETEGLRREVHAL